MTILSNIPYQYCPFCGQELVVAAIFQYCPYCGEKLKRKDHEYKKKLKKLKTTVKDGFNLVAEGSAAHLSSDGSKNSCRNISENIIEDNIIEDNMAIQQVNVMAASTACEATGSLSIEHSIGETDLLPVLPEENHTVILKFCPEPERLFIKLTEILKRDSFAIRLAVKLVPSVLMYKSKLAEVLPVIQACRAEGALLSVVSGNFTLTVDFPKVVLEELSVSEQDLITNSPSALWLGEMIQFAVGEVVSNGKQGILILSNQHLYFVSNGQGFEYSMTPLERVVGVERSEQKKFAALVVRQQDKDSETVYVTSRQQSIAQLQQRLQTAVVAQQA